MCYKTSSKRIQRQVVGFVAAVALASTLSVLIGTPAQASGRFIGSWAGNWGRVAWGDGCDNLPTRDIPHGAAELLINGWAQSDNTYVEYILVRNMTGRHIQFTNGIVIHGVDADDFVYRAIEPLPSGSTARLDLRHAFSGSRLTMNLDPSIGFDDPVSGYCGHIDTQVDSNTANSAIGYRYIQMGGPASDLGWPTTSELDAANGGRWQGFQGGLMLWHSSIPQAYWLKGAILDEFRALGSEWTVGYPTMDEGDAANGGKWQAFQNGRIYWSPSAGAHWVHGAILSQFVNLGSEWTLGYPTTEELAAANGGRWQQFQNRLMLWHPNTGAHSVYGRILDEFRALGSEWTVGYPKTEELAAANGGRWQEFEVGRIYWSSSADAHWVHGAILNQFVNLGSEWTVGYPTTEELAAANGGRWQQFQNRLMLWHPNTGAHSVYGAILAKFREVGSERTLGYPTGEESAWGSGRRQPFQNAWIYWTPTSGAWIEYPCVPGSPC